VYFEFFIKTESETTIQIFNSLGEIVYSINRTLPQGLNTLEWNGSDTDGYKLPAGNYYLKLITNDESATRKLVIVR